MDEQAPGILEVVTQFTADPLWLLAVAVAGWWYLRTERTVRLRGAGRPPPRWKTCSFMAGLAVILLAVVSPVEHWGNTLLWVNFLGFLLLTMIAAPLLVLGSPLTLAFRAASDTGRRRLRKFYRGFPVSWLTFPIVTWLAFAVLTYGWQFTTLTEAAANNWLVRDIQLASLLLVAIAFWTPAFGADPVRWRMNHPLRAFYVLVEMVHKGLFGGMFLSLSGPLHEQLARDLPAWGPSPMTDQRLAIVVLWIGGNLIFLVALGYIIHQWLAYEARNNRRVDRRLALQRQAERERRAALELVFEKGV